MASEHGVATSTPRQGSWPSQSVEERLGLVMEASPTALVLTGPSGQIELVNRQAEQMFGYERSALLGEPLEMLLPERFRHRHVALCDGFLHERSTRMMGVGLDLFGLRQDGTEFPVEIRLNSIEVEGEPMVLAGIVDITTRRDLERSNADLEEFAYAASHDLKAPLRAISHLVQWIGEDLAATANPETLENIRLLQGRTARLHKLMDGLLAYSRVGRTQHAIEDVDIGDLVSDVVTMLAPSPGFVVACEGPMAVIRTHRVPLRVVLINLIGNALKHHDRTEGRIAVSMRQAAGGLTEFRVADDGPGIDPRFQDRIFTIFQTLASQDDIESSGTGLAIVKKKVQAHGGRIWVESAPPVRGATFVFTWAPEAG